MPKPRTTTELCRRVRAIPRLSLMNGCEKLRPKRIPRVSAIGGENHPVKERTRPRAKKIFGGGGLDWERKTRPGAKGAGWRKFVWAGLPRLQFRRPGTLRCFSARLRFASDGES